MLNSSRQRGGGSTCCKEEQLIKNYEEIDGTQKQNHAPGHPEFAVNAKNDQAEGNDAELPDPEAVTVESNDGIDYRVDLDPLLVENHHGEEGVQDVESDHQDEEDKQRGAVAVCIASLLLVGLSPEVLSPTQEGVPAYGGSRFFSSVSGASPVVCFQGG